MNNFERRKTRSLQIRVSQKEHTRNKVYKDNKEIIEAEDENIYEAEILNCESDLSNLKIIQSNSSATLKRVSFSTSEKKSARNENKSTEESKQLNNIATEMEQIRSENQLTRNELEKVRALISRIIDKEAEPEDEKQDHLASIRESQNESVDEFDLDSMAYEKLLLTAII